MQSVFNSIATLSLLGVVLLLFASSALLKMVRDVQAGLTDLQAANNLGGLGGGAAMTVAEFAASDGRPTYVMVVDAGCPACRDRGREFATAAADRLDGHRIALTTDAACEGWFTGGPVRVIVDSALVGRVGVGVTPSLLKYHPDGTEQWRRIVGSTEDLERLLDLAPTGGTGQRVTAV